MKKITKNKRLKLSISKSTYKLSKIFFKRLPKNQKLYIIILAENLDVIIKAENLDVIIKNIKQEKKFGGKDKCFKQFYSCLQVVAYSLPV